MKLLIAVYDLIANVIYWVIDTVRDHVEIFSLLATLIFAASLPYIMAAYDCSVYEQTTTRDTEMKGLTCYVAHDGGFIPMGEYLAFVSSRKE